MLFKVTADNTAYTVSLRLRLFHPNPALQDFVYAETLAEIFLFFSGLSPNCFKKFSNFFFFNYRGE